MKAFMSDSRLRVGHGFSGRDLHAEALTEAHRIKDEVEPHGPAFGCLWPNEPGQQVLRGACLPYTERRILAESLRAWLETSEP